MAMIEINWNPDRRELRRFGYVALIAFGAIGAWAFFRHGLFGFRFDDRASGVAGSILWALAAACGILAAGAPAALRPLYAGLTAIALPIGWVVSHVALGVVFYFVLTPVGLVTQLLRRDPLHRGRRPDAKTYWVRREPPVDPKRYFRQF